MFIGGAGKRFRGGLSRMCIKKGYTMNLRTMRYESIEVQYALRTIMDATMKGRFNGTGEFYEQTLPRFFCETVADLASYGVSVYHIDDDGVPYNVDIATVDIFVERTFPPIFTAEYTGLDNLDIPLHVVVHEHPDIVSLTLRGCISRCINEYIEGRIVTCNEIAIGTSNAQAVYTLDHTSDQKQLEIMRAVNYAHKNSFDDSGAARFYKPDPHTPA